MSTQPPAFRDYSCLTFDCYGTLIDWEGGIYTALAPLTQQLPTTHHLHNNRLATLRAFHKHESRVQSEHPAELYSRVLALTYASLATEMGLATTESDMARFGASVGDWPVYADTVDALHRLHKHFKLVILSNVDAESFDRTLAKQFPGVSFDAVYRAQDIGSYKPDIRNFHYLIEHCERDLGVPKARIVHTAQSLFHDHVPATKVGLTCAWIERGEEVESVMGGDLRDFEGRVGFSWRFKTLGDMADAVDAAYK